MPLRFGTARLDPERRQLVRDGREQHLSPKAFDLLLALVNARPAVLTKDELMARVWPDTFVSDANLAVLIGEVRAAIGDTAREPRFIRTHHAVGYSFVGEVTEVPAPAGVPWSGPRAWLVIGERSVALPQGETVIGRDPTADLAVPDASISRRHARITLTGRDATLEDLDSKNGTRVDGRRIDAPTPLGRRATLSFGTVAAAFFLEERPDSSTMTVRIDT
jgi:DNA-binding winged helix-turn-helix (wHTH) protein